MRTDTEMKEVKYNYCLTLLAQENNTVMATNDIISLERKLDRKLMQWILEESKKKHVVVMNICYLGEEDG